MEYTVVVRQAPDGMFIASFPLISESQSQGETHEDVLPNIKEALELCLEYRRERGEEVPVEIGTSQIKVAV